MSWIVHTSFFRSTVDSFLSPLLVPTVLLFSGILVPSGITASVSAAAFDSFPDRTSHGRRGTPTAAPRSSVDVPPIELFLGSLGAHSNAPFQLLDWTDSAAVKPLSLDCGAGGLRLKLDVTSSTSIVSFEE